LAPFTYAWKTRHVEVINVAPSCKYTHFCKAIIIENAIPKVTWGIYTIVFRVYPQFFLNLLKYGIKVPSEKQNTNARLYHTTWSMIRAHRTHTPTGIDRV